MNKYKFILFLLLGFGCGNKTRPRVNLPDMPAGCYESAFIVRSDTDREVGWCAVGQKIEIINNYDQHVSFIVCRCI